MNISKRAQKIPASPIRKLIPYADEAKRNGVKVYHLNIGQPDIVTPEQMWSKIKEVQDKVLSYGPSNGLLEFREKLSKYYERHNVEISAEDIIVTTGGSEAILFSMMVTCDPEDEIIIPEPYYANYNGFANYAQVNVVPLPTKAENGFRLPDKKTIESYITDKTKAIIFSNPGNPTGVVYTREELIMLLDIAKTYDLIIISDEVYSEFVYEGEFHSILSLKDAEKYSIITDSISKRYSACGARIGCMISKNEELMNAAMKYAQARLCPPTLEQKGAIGALEVPISYYKEVVNEYDARRKTLLEKVNSIEGAFCEPPKGAFYAIVKLPVDDTEKFAKWMLTDFRHNGATTMVAPAEGFYGTPGSGKDEVRLAYILEKEELGLAMDILREGVYAYQKEFNIK